MEFSTDTIVNAIGIGIAIMTFIVERTITFNKEKSDSKYNWFLTIIIEPHLDDIKEFYLETDKDLRNACKDLKSKYDILDKKDYEILARSYCDKFKDRRKLFFNNFVSMVSAFDTNISVEVDNIVNKLDDHYVTAIDFINENADSDGLLTEILMNKALLYQTLFNSISNSKSKYFLYISVGIILVLIGINLF